MMLISYLYFQLKSGNIQCYQIHSHPGNSVPTHLNTGSDPRYRPRLSPADEGYQPPNSCHTRPELRHRQCPLLRASCYRGKYPPRSRPSLRLCLRHTHPQPCLHLCLAEHYHHVNILIIETFKQLIYNFTGLCYHKKL
jgi:hypothetical protein